MTPNPVGMGNPPERTSGSSNLYNSISSQGIAGTSPAMEESQEPTGLNPAEQFIQSFGQAFNPLKELLDNTSYAFASKEASLVKKALENYMEAVVTGLNVQVSQGGESLGNLPY